MADTHDTIDGLLAEFRGYAAGMPPSYHVTMSWHDFRVMLNRFEAAHRRESGDASKLREALELCVKGMCGFCRMDAEARGMTTECVNGCEAFRKAKAALAAPPRNCDLPKVVEDPWRAWIDDESNWEDGNPKLEIHDWLLAPATEEEGGDK
jgi:hypothetical protein